MKPKPLVALNPFTVPMLTGVVPSQDRYSRSPLFDGLVRSNFWKGRQRLNRLYRWIANVVRPKIDWSILCEASPQNNPEVRFFGSIGARKLNGRHHAATRSCPCATSWQAAERGLSAAELCAPLCTTRCSA